MAMVFFRHRNLGFSIEIIFQTVALTPRSFHLTLTQYSCPNCNHYETKLFFRVLLNGINMKMSQAEIDELIEMIDSNRDGEISRDEFVTFFKKLKLIN